jgi:hypothetical protein
MLAQQKLADRVFWILQIEELNAPLHFSCQARKKLTYIDCLIWSQDKEIMAFKRFSPRENQVFSNPSPNWVFFDGNSPNILKNL